MPFGSAMGTERRFQTQPTHHSLTPRTVAQRAAALHAPPHRLQLRFRLRTVHVLDPVRFAG